MSETNIEIEEKKPNRMTRYLIEFIFDIILTQALRR